MIINYSIVCNDFILFLPKIDYSIWIEACEASEEKVCAFVMMSCAYKYFRIRMFSEFRRHLGMPIYIHYNCNEKIYSKYHAKLCDEKKLFTMCNKIVMLDIFMSMFYRISHFHPSRII